MYVCTHESLSNRSCVKDHINDSETQNKQKLKPREICASEGGRLHLSKQWSFTGYLFSVRAPLSSNFTLSSSLSLEIGVKIPRLSPLDHQHTYLSPISILPGEVSTSQSEASIAQIWPIRGQMWHRVDTDPICFYLSPFPPLPPLQRNVAQFSVDLLQRIITFKWSHPWHYGGLTTIQS